MLCDVPKETFALIGLGVAAPPRRPGALQVWVDLRDGSIWRWDQGWVRMTSPDASGHAVLCVPDALVRVEAFAHPGVDRVLADPAGVEEAARRLPAPVLDRLNALLRPIQPAPAAMATHRLPSPARRPLGLRRR